MALAYTPKAGRLIPTDASNKADFDGGFTFLDVKRIVPTGQKDITQPLGGGLPGYFGQTAGVMIFCGAGANATVIDSKADSEQEFHYIQSTHFAAGVKGEKYQFVTIYKSRQPVRSADNDSRLLDVYMVTGACDGDNVVVQEYTYPSA